MTRVLVCCGAGGVGKTTLSAALAVRLAISGFRVAALTIDPARRLADSLGIEAMGTEPRTLALPGIPEGNHGRLEVMMLDAKSTFDRIVRSWAPDPAAAERILDNHYYRAVSDRLGGAQEYMAMVSLLELVGSDRYDFVVLDTPPARQALDFLSAPSRIARVMDQRVLRMLALPQTRAGMRALHERGSTVMRVLNKLVGATPVREVAEFVAAFEGMTEKFRQRSIEMDEFLRSPATLFVVVTTANLAGLPALQDFHAVIQQHGFSFWGFLVNRTTPRPRWTDPLPNDRCPDLLPMEREAQAAYRPATDLFARMAVADQQSLDTMMAGFPSGEQFWPVPAMPTDIHTLEGLARLGANLPVAELLASLGVSP